jgi:HrpA-like RNA helicase
MAKLSLEPLEQKLEKKNRAENGNTATRAPLSKLLLESSRFECGEEALTVVAMMAVDSFFYTPPGKKEEAAQVFFVKQKCCQTV